MMTRQILKGLCVTQASCGSKGSAQRPFPVVWDPSVLPDNVVPELAHRAHK